MAAFADNARRVSPKRMEDFVDKMKPVVKVDLNEQLLDQAAVVDELVWSS